MVCSFSEMKLYWQYTRHLNFSNRVIFMQGIFSQSYTYKGAFNSNWITILK